MTLIDATKLVENRSPPTALPGSPARFWGITLYLTLAAGYFAVGATMSLRYNLVDLDGQSRVANAAFALASRDPHLSAIGFVWNPLPSLIEMPLVPLGRWWPALTTHGLAGVLQSSLFMAGAALMIRRIAIDRAAPRVWRWLAIGCFVINPVIVIYGGAGLSEAAEVFCALWCARYLLRWLNSRKVGDLAWAGIALGVGYLARYEMAFSAIGVALLVAAASLGGRDRTLRVDRTVLNVLIVLFPIGVSFTIWAVTGWVISGELFATLSSQYGNAGQVTMAETKGAAADRAGNSHWLVVATRLLAMQPFAGIAVILAGSLAALHKRLDPLVPVATCGSVLVFAVWGQASGTTFGWFRFYILAIPMVIAVALTCWSPTAKSPGGSWVTKAGATLLCVSLLIGTPVTARAMLNPDIGNQSLQFGLNSLLHPDQYPPDEQWYRRLRNDDKLIAGYLDRQHLPPGSVLMESFVGWGIWLYSDNPKQFVITSDYEFTAALNRPWDYGIQYIIVSNPSLNDAIDEINGRYPTLWADGAGFGRLAYSADGATGQERWRIYRVDGPPEPPRP